MSKKYGFYSCNTLPDYYKDICYQLGYRRIHNTGRPYYVDLIGGHVFKVAKNNKLKQLKETTNKNGYPTVKLKQTNGAYKTYSIHMLVALYCKGVGNKDEVHHIDTNKLNNSHKNLIWVTHKEHGEIHALYNKDINAYTERITQIKNENNKEVLL